MQPLRTLSLWMDQLDEPLCARPALRDDLDVDVCIIGAGYTGLWTAYYLKRQAPQLNIAVIEANIAGFGASGRNGGWLMGNLLGEDRLLATLSPQQRRASIDLLHGIPDEVHAVLQGEAIDWQPGEVRTPLARIRCQWTVPAVEGYAASLPPPVSYTHLTLPTN